MTLSKFGIWTMTAAAMVMNLAVGERFMFLILRSKLAAVFVVLSAAGMIIVSSPQVAAPQHVRYGWAWNPLVNLYNAEGLPAITFRTDE